MGFKVSERSSRKHKRGLWSPEEDRRLQDYIVNHGISCWSSVPTHAGLQRTGKSCRLRWVNYLRPGLKRGLFTSEEEETIINLHKNLGNKWSQIAKQLPGRTDNEIKNVWHSYLKKKAAKSNASQSNPQTNFRDLTCKEENDFSSSETMTGSIITEFQTQPIKIQDHQQPNMEQKEPISLRRIVFSDWLSTENSTSQNGPDFQQISSLEGLESNLSVNQDEDFLQRFLNNNNEGSSICVNDFGQDGFNDSFQYEMLGSPFSFTDQSTLGSCFMALSAENADIYDLF